MPGQRCLVTIAGHLVQPRQQPRRRCSGRPTCSPRQPRKGAHPRAYSVTARVCSRPLPHRLLARRRLLSPHGHLHLHLPPPPRLLRPLRRTRCCSEQAVAVAAAAVAACSAQPPHDAGACPRRCLTKTTARPSQPQCLCLRMAWMLCRRRWEWAGRCSMTTATTVSHLRRHHGQRRQHPPLQPGPAAPRCSLSLRRCWRTTRRRCSRRTTSRRRPHLSLRVRLLRRRPHRPARLLPPSTP